MARTMFNANNLPNSFWAKAVNTTYYMTITYLLETLKSRPVRTLAWKKTEHRIYFKDRGYKCFILNTKESLQKFDSKSREGIFLKNSTTCKAYRVYNKTTPVVEESMHAIFYEANVLLVNCSDFVDDPMEGEVRLRQSLLETTLNPDETDL